MSFPAKVFSLLSLVLLLCGCEVVRLSNGKYESTLPGRGDFAAVYGDLIILRLRNPVNESGTEDGYWEWGGKYEIIDDNVIELAMDRENKRNWKFYYELRKQDNAIRVLDHRAENSYRLEHIPAVPDRRSAPRNAPAAYPAYR